MIGTAVGPSVARGVVRSPNWLNGRGCQVSSVVVDRSARSAVCRLHRGKRGGELGGVIDQSVAVVHPWLACRSLMVRWLRAWRVRWQLVWLLLRLLLLMLLLLLLSLVVELLLKRLLLQVVLLMLLGLVVLRGELVHPGKILRSGKARWRHGRSGNVVLLHFCLRRE